MKVITIDGPAGSGKSTVAQALSRRLGIPYLSTGLLYRALALAALRAKLKPESSQGLLDFLAQLRLRLTPTDDRSGFVIWLDDRPCTERDMKTPEVSQSSSEFSVLPEVRAKLLDLQRSAARPAGVIVDGRDTGSVVFPQADLKVYLKADAGERARRRARELGLPETDAATLAEIEARDSRDSHRSAAPLVVPASATVIDSTDRTVEQVVDDLLQLLA